MTFNDAWGKYLSLIPLDGRIQSEKEGLNFAKGAAMGWSLAALAMNEAGFKNVLDDIAYVSNNMSIQSTPFPKEQEPEKKGSSSKKLKEDNDDKSTNE